VAKVGADLGQLAVLKQTFDRQAEAVVQLTRSIDSQIAEGNTWWVGPAADKFRGEWRGTFKSNLAQLEQALREAGMEVDRRRQMLEQAGS
jgi:WXG100 family type VII secretion target